MAFQNPHFAKRLMQLRVEEELRRAELNRLRREAVRARPDWRRRLNGLAHKLRLPAWRSEDHSEPQAVFRHSRANRGA